MIVLCGCLTVRYPCRHVVRLYTLNYERSLFSARRESDLAGCCQGRWARGVFFLHLIRIKLKFFFTKMRHAEGLFTPQTLHSPDHFFPVSTSADPLGRSARTYQHVISSNVLTHSSAPGRERDLRSLRVRFSFSSVRASTRV